MTWGAANFAYSALLMASAAGAVFGGFLLEGKGWLKRRFVTRSFAPFCGVAITSFAFSTNYYLSVALLFCAGILNLSFYSTAQAIVQIEAPSHLRGRLIGIFSMSAFGLRAFSGLTVGVVGGLIGIHRSLASSAMALMAVTFACWRLPVHQRAAAKSTESARRSPRRACIKALRNPTLVCTRFQYPLLSKVNLTKRGGSMASSANQLSQDDTIAPGKRSTWPRSITGISAFISSRRCSR